MIRTRLVLLLSALLVLATSACTTLTGRSASPVLDGIRERGTLRVGMSGDYAPLNVTSRSGEVIGLEPSLARALAESLGAQLEIVVLPFSQLLPALDEGKVDAVMAGVTMTPERNMRAAFAGPYLVSGKAILSKSQTLAKAESMDALDRSKVKIAVLEGSTSEQILRRSAPSANIVVAPNYDVAVRMVVDDEVDALFADYPVCVLSVLRNPNAGLASVVAPLSFEPIGIALPATDPLFVNLVQNYLTLLEGTGLLDGLRARWLQDPSWLAQLP